MKCNVILARPCVYLFLLFFVMTAGVAMAFEPGEQSLEVDVALKSNHILPGKPLILDITFLNVGEERATFSYAYPTDLFVTLAIAKTPVHTLQWLPKHFPSREKTVSIDSGESFREMIVVLWSFQEGKVMSAFAEGPETTICIVVDLGEQGYVASAPLTIAVDNAPEESQEMPSDELAQKIMLLLVPPGEIPFDIPVAATSDEVLGFVGKWSDRDDELGYLARHALRRVHFWRLIRQCEKGLLWGKEVHNVDAFLELNALPPVVREHEYSVVLERERKLMESHLKILLWEFDSAKRELREIVSQEPKDSITMLAEKHLRDWTKLLKKADKWDDLRQKVKAR